MLAQFLNQHLHHTTTWCDSFTSADEPTRWSYIDDALELIARDGRVSQKILTLPTKTQEKILLLVAAGLYNELLITMEDKT